MEWFTGLSKAKVEKEHSYDDEDIKTTKDVPDERHECDQCKSICTSYAGLMTHKANCHDYVAMATALVTEARCPACHTYFQTVKTARAHVTKRRCFQLGTTEWVGRAEAAQRAAQSAKKEAKARKRKGLSPLPKIDPRQRRLEFYAIQRV